MSQSFDVIVIGAGPAGYVAAIRCAQLGLSTACIDDWQDAEGNAAPGGTCLNVGCIPSKALLESSALFDQANHDLAGHGISIGKAKIDIKAMQARKESVVKRLTGGIAQLLKANKISFFHGKGRVLNANQVSVLDNKTGKINDTLTAKDIILATGSEPIELPGFSFDGENILDSAHTLALKTVPEHLVIVGAGVIGLELGSVWARLGAKITILEAMDSLLPMVDKNLVREAARQFKKQGINIILGAKVSAYTKDATKLKVEYAIGDEAMQIEASHIAVMVGRKANTDALLAPDSGIETDERGKLIVDANCQTNVGGVWAIGDAVRGPMLAHKGSEEGVAVAESIASGRKQSLDLSLIPSVIYTHPEIAWIGETEQALKDSGVEYKLGAFPFAASGRAQASGQTGGMIKILADTKTDRILGAHIIGEHASELLAEVIFAMQYEASAEDLGRTIHSHPSLSEALKEAALSVHKEAIHKAN